MAGLRTARGIDRIGIIAFNQQAWVVTSLSSDRDLIKRQLATVLIGHQSRLDLGFHRAVLELVTRGRATAMKSVVVLSDGWINPSQPGAALEESGEARRAGIDVYCVGIGPDDNRSLLTAMATAPDHYVSAAQPTALVAILADLTTRIPCPPGAFWRGE